MNEQLVQTEEAHEKESAQEKYLTDRIEELDQLLEERSAAIDAKAETLQSAEMEPGRLERQISSIENALNSMDTENRSFARKIKMFDSEQESQARRRIETEKQRKTILEKLELNRQTLEEREQDTATVKSNLEKAKALNHDLITTRVEVNVRRRDIDSKLRHLNDQFALATKDYEILKRQIKKKRSVMDSSKEILPILEAQLQDQEILLKNHLEEKAHKKREIQKMKDEIDSQVNRLLQQEGLEKDKKRVRFALVFSIAISFSLYNSHEVTTLLYQRLP